MSEPFGATTITVGEIRAFGPCYYKWREFRGAMRKRLGRSVRSSDSVTYRTIAEVSGLHGLAWLLGELEVDNAQDFGSMYPNWLFRYFWMSADGPTSDFLVAHLTAKERRQQQSLIQRYLRLTPKRRKARA